MTAASRRTSSGPQVAPVGPIDADLVVDPPPVGRAVAPVLPGQVAGWADSRAKRLFDLVVSAIVALVTLPLLLVLCAISAVVFRANPLFTQERIGLDGRPLRFVKLRSLSTSVPSDIDKYALATQPVGRWGRFVRRSHLDELPQVWLVLAGHMSLVGPRPELPAIAAGFEPGFVRRRTRVRPGVTGLWQVSEAARGLIGEVPEFDDLYVESASCRLDLWVLARTLSGPLGASPATIDECRRAAGRTGGDAEVAPDLSSAG